MRQTEAGGAGMQSSVMRDASMKRAALAVLAVLAVLSAYLVFDPEHGSMPAGAPAHAADAPVALSPPVAGVPDPGIQDQDLPYREACAREGLSESECVGRLIWFKATGVSAAWAGAAACTGPSSGPMAR